MIRYSKIQSSLWSESKKFKRLSITERYVYLYLLTCQHGNSAGIYRMIPNYSAYDCNMKLEDYDRTIEALCISGLIDYDKEQNVVFIKQYMKFNPVTNGKHASGTAKVAREFIESFVYKGWYEEAVLFFKGFDSTIDSPINTTMVSQSIQQNTEYRIQNIEYRDLKDSCSTSEEVKPAKNDTTLFDDDSEEIKISKHLFKKMLVNNPEAKEPNFQSWAKDVDKIIRIDKRSVEDIYKVIDWCQKDPFWLSNILSPSKLRKQYDQLKIKKDKKSGFNSFVTSDNSFMSIARELDSKIDTEDDIKELFKVD